MGQYVEKTKEKKDSFGGGTIQAYIPFTLKIFTEIYKFLSTK